MSRKDDYVDMIMEPIMRSTTLLAVVISIKRKHIFVTISKIFGMKLSIFFKENTVY